MSLLLLIGMVREQDIRDLTPRANPQEEEEGRIMSSMVNHGGLVGEGGLAGEGGGLAG